jgi:AraC-like DNA-binding protein
MIASRMKLSYKDGLHLIPFMVFYAYFLFPYYLRSGDYKIAFYKSIEQNGPSPALIFFSWVVLFQGVIYMQVTFRLLKRHAVNIKSAFSSLENINLNWLKRITIMTMIVWILGIIIEFLQMFDLNSAVQSTVPVAITILIYAMGYLGLRQPEIFSGRNEADTGELKKYERSGLTREMSRSIHEKLTELMVTKKLYRDSNLKLSQLAHMVATSPNYLSQVINEQRQQNFYDFVNSFRIEEAKRLITDPSHHNENLLSIAYNVGFNSKSAFNTAFKKHTGMTPTQYRTGQRH